MPEQEFANGFRTAAAVLVWINTLAILPSLLRGDAVKQAADAGSADASS